MKIEKSAGVILFCIKDGEPHFLLLEYPTYWGFIRGQIEADEKIAGKELGSAQKYVEIDKKPYLFTTKGIRHWIPHTKSWIPLFEKEDEINGTRLGECYSYFRIIKEGLK